MLADHVRAFEAKFLGGAKSRSLRHFVNHLIRGGFHEEYRDDPDLSDKANNICRIVTEVAHVPASSELKKLCAQFTFRTPESRAQELILQITNGRHSALPVYIELKVVSPSNPSDETLPRSVDFFDLYLPMKVDDETKNYNDALIDELRRRGVLVKGEVRKYGGWGRYYQVRKGGPIHVYLEQATFTTYGLELLKKAAAEEKAQRQARDEEEARKQAEADAEREKWRRRREEESTREYEDSQLPFEADKHIVLKLNDGQDIVFNVTLDRQNRLEDLQWYIDEFIKHNYDDEFWYVFVFKKGRLPNAAKFEVPAIPFRRSELPTEEDFHRAFHSLRFVDM